MLRALQGFLGTGVPVVGVNFGRVGFLSSIGRDELENGVRASSEESSSVRASDLDVEVEAKARRRQRRRRRERRAGPDGRARVVDRRPELRPRPVRRPDLLDAIRLDGLQPLERRPGPDVGPRRDGADVRRAARPPRPAVRRATRARLEVWNRTADVGCAVLVDGHHVGDAGPEAQVSIRLGEGRSLLGTLPDATFVRRYRQSFGTS